MVIGERSKSLARVTVTSLVLEHNITYVSHRLVKRGETYQPVEVLRPRDSEGIPAILGAGELRVEAVARCDIWGSGFK